VVAIAREHGGMKAAEQLGAAEWPTLLADYRIRQKEGDSQHHGKEQSRAR